MAARFLTSIVLALSMAAGTALLAANRADSQPMQAPLENIQIGLSTNRVVITSDFAGTDLTIFGALDNIHPLTARQGRYDIIVVLEGPPRSVVVRKKSRILGMWINTESQSFVNVPASLSLATSRALQDITTPATYRQMALGPDNINISPLDANGDPATLEEFTAALRERKRAADLFSERIGGVQFLSQNLFRATLRLPPSVPVGTHRARAFLFKNGVFIRDNTAQLAIVKSGLEQRISRAAHDQSLFYGLFAIFLAMATGWLGRVFFKRD